VQPGIHVSLYWLLLQVNSFRFQQCKSAVLLAIVVFTSLLFVLQRISKLIQSFQSALMSMYLLHMPLNFHFVTFS
jgi:hypothetical protein